MPMSGGVDCGQTGQPGRSVPQSSQNAILSGMPVYASQLRTRLYVEQRAEHQPLKADWDRTQPEWRPVASLRANIEEKTGTERLAAGGMASMNQYKITTRYRAGIQPTHRLRDAETGEIYNIASVHRDRGKWLVINATKSDLQHG